MSSKFSRIPASVGRLLPGLVLVSLFGCATTADPLGSEAIEARVRLAQLAASSAEADTTAAQQLFIRGMRHEMQGDYETAIEYFGRALMAVPNQPAVLMATAEAHHELDDVEAARFFAQQAHEADPDAQFDVVGSAAFVGDSHIAVVNGGSAEIFLFDYDGRRIATLGGRGGGPGEFAPRTPIAIPSKGDTIRVAGFEPRAQKIAYFARTGEVLGEHIAPPETRLRGAFSSPAVDPSGLMFFINFPLDPRELIDEQGQPVGESFRIPLRAQSGQDGSLTITPDLTPMRRALEAMAATDPEGVTP